MPVYGCLVALTAQSPAQFVQNGGAESGTCAVSKTLRHKPVKKQTGDVVGRNRVRICSTVFWALPTGRFPGQERRGSTPRPALVSTTAPPTRAGRTDKRRERGWGGEGEIDL